MGTQPAPEEPVTLPAPESPVTQPALVEIKAVAKKGLCNPGDHVKCPGSGRMCAGNQCCPRSYPGGLTFPCPSAENTWTSLCESAHKWTDCTTADTPEPSPAPENP